MIDSVWIRDFRGIHTAHVTGLRSINVLVGPNNSGKTAFLEALYLGCGVGRQARGHTRQWHSTGLLPTTDFLQELPMVIVRRKHLHAAGLLDAARITQRQSSDNLPFSTVTVRIDAKAAPQKTLELSTREDATPEDWPDGYRKQLALIRYMPHTFTPLDGRHSTQLRSAPERLFGHEEWDIPNDCHLVHFWDRPFTYHYAGQAAWYLTGTPAVAQHTFFYDAQQTLAHIPTDFYTNMISVVPGWSQKIAQRVGRVLGITEPFNVLFMPTGPDKEWMQGQIAFADRPALPIDDFGDGARAVFKVLAPLIALAELVTAEEPGIFLWEEPELFQNPLTLGRLLAEVADLAQSRPLQVFMATHSLEVVAHLVQQVQAGTLKEEALCTLTTQLYKGAFTAQASSTDEIRIWTRMHQDLRVPGGYTGSPLHFSMDAPTGLDNKDGGDDE